MGFFIIHNRNISSMQIVCVLMALAFRTRRRSCRFNFSRSTGFLHHHYCGWLMDRRNNTERDHRSREAISHKIIDWDNCGLVVDTKYRDEKIRFGRPCHRFYENSHANTAVLCDHFGV